MMSKTHKTALPALLSYCHPERAILPTIRTTGVLSCLYANINYNKCHCPLLLITSHFGMPMQNADMYQLELIVSVLSASLSRLLSLISALLLLLLL